MILSRISSRIISTTDYNGFAVASMSLLWLVGPHSHFMINLRSPCLVTSCYARAYSVARNQYGDFARNLVYCLYTATISLGAFEPQRIYSYKSREAALTLPTLVFFDSPAR